MNEEPVVLLTRRCATALCMRPIFFWRQFRRDNRSSDMRLIPGFCLAVVAVFGTTVHASPAMESYSLEGGREVLGMNGKWRGDVDTRVVKCEKGEIREYVIPDVVSEPGYCLFVKNPDGLLARARGLSEAAELNHLPVLVWSAAQDKWVRP